MIFRASHRPSDVNCGTKDSFAEDRHDAQGQIAVIHGAGGDVGGAVARAFAREGAKLFLSGRNLGTVKAVAANVIGRGGVAEAAQVDALDEQAVEEYVSAVAEKAGTIDISFNAISIAKALPTKAPLLDLSAEHFALRSRPIRRRIFSRRGARRAGWSRGDPASS
jgi:saccharopine dehydrogenase-like NADP-dependent oxidoreductase